MPTQDPKDRAAPQGADVETRTVNRQVPLGEEPPMLPDALEVGALVGDYRVVSLLGTGGCARVYEARHPVLGRRVAIKVLNRELTSSAQMVQRFIREAQVVNRAHHPNIADIYDFGTLPEGRPYYVMEFLEGQSLVKLVHDRGRLSPTEVLELLEPLCRALKAAHDIGVVHRDVKGSNVMVSTSGGVTTVKLLDFGIAKLMQPEPGEVPLTTETQRLGSPPYMAPEQILGTEIDARSDVYSLGIVLFYMLTGALPFWSREALGMFRMHLEAEPPRPSTLAPLSTAIDAVVLKCLAKQKEKRFAGTMELLDAFRHAIALASEGPRQPTPAPNRAARGFALQLTVHLNDDADDAAHDTASAMVLELEERTGAQGLQPFLVTALSLLVVRVLPDELAEAQKVIRDAGALANSLYEQARTAISDSIGRVTVFLHVGDIDIKIGAQGVTVVGGPLVEAADWPISATRGWYMTRDALALLNT